MKEGETSKTRTHTRAKKVLTSRGTFVVGFFCTWKQRISVTRDRNVGCRLSLKFIVGATSRGVDRGRERHSYTKETITEEQFE